jgi:hypothetical protein
MFNGILNKIKYGAVVAFVVDLIRQFGGEVPGDVESALEKMAESLVVLIPFIMAFFIKESEETKKRLKV